MAEDNFDGKPLKDNLKEAAKAFENIRVLGSESEDIFQSIATALTGMARDSKEFGSQIGSASDIQKQLAKDAKFLASAERKILTDKKEIKKFEAASARLAKNRLELDSKIKVLSQLRANASKAEQKILDKTIENLRNGGDYAAEIASNFKQIEEANKKLNQDTSWLEGMADLADDIPVVGKLFGDFKKGAEEARKAGAEGGSALAAGARAMGGAVGKLALVFSGAVFLKGINKADQDITDLSRNLGLTRDNARELDRQFREVGIAVKGISGEDLKNATMAVSDELGVTADLSIKSGIAIAAMTKKLGLSAEQAASLATFSASTGQNIEDVQNNIIGTVQLQNLSNNTAIRYQDIMKDISEASSATRMSVSNFPGGIAKAAYQARKLGLSFSTMESIASNLLDFETSIANEMEAELLIGRDLNLNAARMAANRNDLVGMSQELAKNGITQEKFANMTFIQQDAVAKAMGMTREEMADMYETQKAIEDLGGDPSKGIEESVRARFKEIQLMDEGAEKEAALEKLRNTAGATEITRQLENKSLAEAQKEAMKDMTAAVGDLAIALEPITKFFGKISTLAGETFGFITKMGSKLKAVAAFGADFALQGRFIQTAFKSSAGFVTKLFKSLGSGIKIAGKGGLKSILKKIPILGALVGAGLAYQRAKKGDWLGAGAELLSGIASIFPGFGTAASVALDGLLMAGDLSGTTGGDRRVDGQNFTTQGQGKSNKVTVGDFVVQPLQTDTITMAGGTKLGGNVEALLEELISIVKGGGNVYLDGTKVGSTLVLNSKLSN